MSNELTVAYEGAFHAVARMMPGDCRVTIDAPASCGGSGESFSPKDLFAAGYASCVIMAMDMAARKRGFDIAGAKVKVSLVSAMGEKPVIDEVNATVVLPREYAEEELNILRRGAGYCPIHNSLRSETKTTLAFEVA